MAAQPLMREFDWIKRYFAPLADSPAALSLRDDAALLKIPAGYELAISADMLNEGIHFLPDTTPALIAHKALAVNLSDLAAMGAAPLGYSLLLSLPKEISEDWVAEFSSGLEEMQRLYGLSLLGGDTTATHGALCIGITIYGLCKSGKALRRSGANAGDDIYVSGTIGDGLIGLMAAKEGIYHPLRARYEQPTPRVALGQTLIDLATSCMDVSDGLIQDAQHLCTASGVGAQIFLADIPIAPEALTTPRLELACGGDDYELLFTAPPSRHNDIQAAASHSGIAVTRIGTMTAGSVFEVLDESGNIIVVAKSGYQHF